MLVTINNKNYGFFNRNLPIYKEVEKLLSLSKTGTAKEVLAQMNACQFDNKLIQSPFIIRENSPIPVHPMEHPFTSACSYQNYPVVRLLLELGLDVDEEWEFCSHHLLRHRFANNATLMGLFEEGLNWWKVEYPESAKQELQEQLKHHILADEVSEAIWLMLHGVQLTAPDFLKNEEFKKLPRPFRELVCSLGIPENRLDEFHTWLKANDAESDTTEILDTIRHVKNDEEQNLAQKLIFSVNLLSDDNLDILANRTFSFSTQIILLKGLLKAYDASSQRPFVTKTIASLLRSILDTCWAA